MKGCKPVEGSTREQILAYAECLVRRKGFNGFSYADIALGVGISKPTIHHYFPAKSDLGLALIERLTQTMQTAIETVEAATNDPADHLKAYIAVYRETLEEGKMCLCGALAAEHETLSAKMQHALTAYFEMHVTWLSKVFDSGRRMGRLCFDGAPKDHAQTLLGVMQGGLLMAKSTALLVSLDSIIANLLRTYCRPAHSEALQA